MSDETIANKGATVDDALGGGITESPVEEALSEAISIDPESIAQMDDIDSGTYDDSDLGLSIEEAVGAVAQQEKAPKEEEVVLTKAQYETLLAQLEGEAAAELGDTVAPAPKAEEIQEAPALAQQPVVAPLAVAAPDWETFSNIVTDPDAFNQYMGQFASQIQQQTLQAMAPFIANQVAITAAANRFEADFFEKHPAMKQYPQLVVKALQKAQRETPNASFDDLFVSTEKNLEYVLNVKSAIEKSGTRKDVRGRFAPKGGTRSSHAGQPKPKVDPTTEAFNDMYALPQSPSSDLMRAIGAF